MSFSQSKSVLNNLHKDLRDFNHNSTSLEKTSQNPTSTNEL